MYPQLQSDFQIHHQGKPRQQIATGSVATTSLKGQFRAADAILNDRLDNLVFPYKNSAPDFFNAYQTARSMVDSGSTRKSKTTPSPRSATGGNTGKRTVPAK